ncbi:MAG: hypothetical protein ACT6FE_07435 [Methanosarcinaceae archaeon]
MCKKTDELEKFSYSGLLKTLREVDGKTINNVIRLAFHVCHK